MRVYVILVNFNGWCDTIECLESLKRLNYPDFRIVVCDNGSKDDSLVRILEWAKEQSQLCNTQSSFSVAKSNCQVPLEFSYSFFSASDAEVGGIRTSDPFLTIINCGSNRGFGGGNNVGLMYALARGDWSYVWLLNNDTVVHPDSLKALVERMQSVPSAGMCGSTLLHYGNPERVQALGGGYYCKWIGLPWHIGRLRTVGYPFSSRMGERWMNYVVGASLLVSKQFVTTVGLMTEEYFLYFEELDWALRGKDLFSLAYAPESIVYHKIGASIGTTSNPATKSYLSDFCNIRNRIVFTRKYFPYALPTIYLSLLAAMLLRALCGKWERVGMIWWIMTAGDIPLPPVGARP